jgi:hypothetical protein
LGFFIGLHFIPAQAGIKVKVLQKNRLVFLPIFELSGGAFCPKIRAMAQSRMAIAQPKPAKGA